MTFAEFAATVLDMRAEDGVRGIAHERNRYETHIEHAAFAQKELEAITAVDLRDWVREMLAKPAADNREPRKLDPGTVKRAFALVSSVFTVAVERDLLKVSPCHGVKVKKRADASATKEKWAFLTFEEQRTIRLCKAIPFADRLTIRFAIGTGLRQGEQFSLRLADLHVGVDEPHVLVRFGGPRDLPPKSGKTRRVPLFGDALVAARHWLYELGHFAPHNPLGLVFPSPRGRRRGIGKPLGAGSTLRVYLAAAGIKRRVRWHDLRHTAATNLVTGVLGRRWTLEEVKPYMGHSSVTISERYAHVGDDALKVAARETALAQRPLASTAPELEREAVAS